jgi:hypothetical protein
VVPCSLHFLWHPPWSFHDLHNLLVLLICVCASQPAGCDVAIPPSKSSNSGENSSSDTILTLYSLMFTVSLHMYKEFIVWWVGGCGVSLINRSVSQPAKSY